MLTCGNCGSLFERAGGPGRNPKNCYKCRGVEPPDPPPSSPFTTTASDRAPLPTVTVRDGAGPLEASLTAELGALTSANPLAGTLGLVALKIAAAADAAPAEDLKQVLAAVKELRSVIDQITKAGGESSNGPAENNAGGPFGAVRAEVVHAPAV